MQVFWQARQAVYEEKIVGFWGTLGVSLSLRFYKTYKLQYVISVYNF